MGIVCLDELQTHDTQEYGYHEGRIAEALANEEIRQQSAQWTTGILEGAVLAEPVAGTHIHDKALVDGRCGEIGYECHDKPYGTDKQNDTEYEIEDIIL